MYIIPNAVHNYLMEKIKYIHCTQVIPKKIEQAMFLK